MNFRLARIPIIKMTANITADLSEKKRVASVSMSAKRSRKYVCLRMFAIAA